MYFFKENINIQLIIFLIFLIWISYLVYTDNRFKFNRKVLFFFIIAVLLIFSYYIDKVPYLIIKDLFWYSLVLNGSFIFHVLILSRIFHFCWEKHYEYLGFIISRISFTLSFSILLYWLSSIYNKTQEIYIYYKIKSKSISGNFFCIIIKFIQVLINILRIILIHFSNLFCNYSLVLLGRNDHQYSSNIIIKYIVMFLVFLILSIIIGIPRLFIIWIFQGFLEICKILNLEYQNINIKNEFRNLKFLDKIKYTYNNYNKIIYLSLCYENKKDILEKIYEKPYHIFFMFDLFKFTYNKYKGIYSEIWGSVDTIYEDYNENLIYPILKIYKFYSWEDIAFGYIKASNLVYVSNGYDLADRSKADRLAEALFWCDLINKNQLFILKMLPDLVKIEDFPLPDKLVIELKNRNNFYFHSLWLENY